MSFLADMKKIKAMLPQPCGYKLLIALPPQSETTAGGVFVSDTQREREKTASILGNVIAVGPEAYKDITRYPNGPWCKEGDWIMFKSFAGTRCSIKGQEFRVIHEDTVDAVVPDPRLVERVGAITAPVTGKEKK